MMTGSQRSETKIAVSQVENEGGGVDLDKDGAASSAEVPEVNQNIEKGDGNEEEPSNNVDTKDSRKADRNPLGDEDEIFNDAIDFHVFDNKTFDGVTSSFLAADDKAEGDIEAIVEEIGLKLDKGGVICSLIFKFYN